MTWWAIDVRPPASERDAVGAWLVARTGQAIEERDDGTLITFAADESDADRIMQEIKLRGVVNGPLDDKDDYEAALSNLGIGQPLASQFAPAVLESLAATGHSRERDILARVIG